MKGKALAIIIVLMFLPSFYRIGTVTALDNVEWRIDEGDIFPCRLITGQLYGDEFLYIDRLAKLRIDTIPVGGYLGNVSTWEELPDIEVMMLIDPNIETDFESLVTSAGISYTGVDWFKAVLPSPGSDEEEWDSIDGLFVSTWTVGPWGVPIDVEIIPDESPFPYDHVFWNIGYSFSYEDVQYNVTMGYHVASYQPNSWYSGLIANGTIVARNATTNELIHFLQLICDPTAPNVYGEISIAYTEGDIGNTLSWQVAESMPNEYRIYRNGTEVDSGNLHTNFDTQTTSYYDSGGGGILTFNIDGLSPGVYNLTLAVSNYVGNLTSNNRIVLVQAIPLGLETLVLAVGGVGLIVVLGVIIAMKRRSS